MHYHGHRERLRKRLREAPESLADYEILELLLGYVLLRRDTKPIAKALLSRYSNLRGVIDAPPESLRAVEGIGPAVENFWALLQEIGARHAESPLRERAILASPETVGMMARERLGKLSHEEMWVAYVDNQNRLIEWERASRGTVNASVIFPRDIMERALLLKATGFILVHNHPGGEQGPSGADLELTKNLQRAARPLAIRFVDHVIVTENSSFSLKEEGKL